MESTGSQDQLESDLEKDAIAAAVENYRRAVRKEALKEFWIGALLVVVPLLFFLFGKISFQELFRIIYFVLGIVIVASGLWALRQAKTLTVKDWLEHQQAQVFAESLNETKPYYAWLILGCLVAVGFCQPVFDAKDSIQAAGLVKEKVWQGEWWRLLTCTTLHVNFIHIWMNGLSLLGLGKLIESLANRCYLTLVFLASAIFGSFFSLILLPQTTSVGASGGLMGLIGFLVVIGRRRREKLPPNFSRDLLENLCLIGVIGLVGIQFIDNAAHVGGLVTGVLVGSLTVSKANPQIPIIAHPLTVSFGMISLLAIIGISAFSVVLIFRG